MKKSKEIQLLQDTQQIFKVLIETSPDCIKLFTTDGKLLFINKGGLKEHRLKSLEEALAKNWNALDTIIPEDQVHFKKALFNAAHGKASIIHIRHKEAASRRKSCSELIAPVMKDKKVIGVLGISRDISSMVT